MIFFKLDVAFENQLFFQDTATPTMSGIIDLHQHVFSFMIIILVLVLFQIADLITYFRLEGYLVILEKCKKKINKFLLFDEKTFYILKIEQQLLKRFKKNILKIKKKFQKKIRVSRIFSDLRNINPYVIESIIIFRLINKLTNKPYFRDSVIFVLFVIFTVFFRRKDFNKAILKFYQVFISINKFILNNKKKIDNFKNIFIKNNENLKNNEKFNSIDVSFSKTINCIYSNRKTNRFRKKKIYSSSIFSDTTHDFEFDKVISKDCEEILKLQTELVEKFQKAYEENIFSKNHFQGVSDFYEKTSIESLSEIDELKLYEEKLYLSSFLIKHNSLLRPAIEAWTYFAEKMEDPFYRQTHLIDRVPLYKDFIEFIIQYGFFKTNFFKKFNFQGNGYQTFLYFVSKLKLLRKKVSLYSKKSFYSKKFLFPVVNLKIKQDQIHLDRKKQFQNISRFVFFVKRDSLFLKNLEIYLRKNLIRSILKTKIEKFTHNTNLETIWTIIPILIVLSIAIPSFVLLYALDAALDGSVTIKVIGHQWYWNYECEFISEYDRTFVVRNYTKFVHAYALKTGTTNNLNSFASLLMRAGYPLVDEIFLLPTDSIKFDSYMVYDANLQLGALRLLEVDKPIFVPYRLPIDIVITSTDVLHSWAVPSLGVKVDAVPGRLNHVGVFIERKGVFFGQCSELCGVNHAFMPIKLVSLSLSDYMNNCFKYKFE